MHIDLSTRALAGLSATCLLKLTTSLATSPLSTCVATSSLTPFFSLLSGSSSESLLPTLSTYLDNVCPAPVCSNETVRGALRGIEESCSEVFSSLGVNNQTVDAYVPYLPQAKNIVCLESNSTSAASNGSSIVASSYCSVQTLSSFQQALGQNLTFNLVQQVISGQTTLAKLLPSSSNAANLTTTLCTPCAQAIYIELNQLSNSTSSSSNNNTADSTGLFSQVKTYLGDLCGSNFTDASTTPSTVTNGTNPSSIINSASSAGFATFSSVHAAGVFAIFGAVGMMI